MVQVTKPPNQKRSRRRNRGYDVQCDAVKDVNEDLIRGYDSHQLLQQIYRAFDPGIPVTLVHLLNGIPAMTISKQLSKNMELKLICSSVFL